MGGGGRTAVIVPDGVTSGGRRHHVCGDGAVGAGRHDAQRDAPATVVDDDQRRRIG